MDSGWELARNREVVSGVRPGPDSARELALDLAVLALAASEPGPEQASAREAEQVTEWELGLGDPALAVSAEARVAERRAQDLVEDRGSEEAAAVVLKSR